jgi:hypothetical protein
MQIRFYLISLKADINIWHRRLVNVWIRNPQEVRPVWALELYEVYAIAKKKYSNFRRRTSFAKRPLEQ